MLRNVVESIDIIVLGTIPSDEYLHSLVGTQWLDLAFAREPFTTGVHKLVPDRSYELIGRNAQIPFAHAERALPHPIPKPVGINQSGKIFLVIHVCGKPGMISGSYSFLFAPRRERGRTQRDFVSTGYVEVLEIMRRDVSLHFAALAGYSDRNTAVIVDVHVVVRRRCCRRRLRAISPRRRWRRS